MVFRVVRGEVGRDGRIQTEAVRAGVEAFERAFGRPPVEVRVRPGRGEQVAAVLRELGLSSVRVTIGNGGILEGEVWIVVVEDPPPLSPESPVASSSEGGEAGRIMGVLDAEQRGG